MQLDYKDIIIKHYALSMSGSEIARQTGFSKSSVNDFLRVDLRDSSATYGKWFDVVLSDENKKQFLIPEGFAHGFLVLSDEIEFCYKVNDCR